MASSIRSTRPCNDDCKVCDCLFEEDADVSILGTAGQRMDNQGNRKSHKMGRVGGTHCWRVSLASHPSLRTSAEFLRGLMARASSGGNSSSSISISGWSRGTRMDALGFRLANRGRSALDLRSCSCSCSVSETEPDEDEDDDDLVAWWWPFRLASGGIAGTGDAVVESAMWARRDEPLFFLSLPCSPER